MKTKYWFKPKRYGYGFVPFTWEGWACTAGLVIVLLFMGEVNHLYSGETAQKDVIGFLFDVLILAGFFTFLFRNKVEGGLKWRWGEKNK